MPNQKLYLVQALSDTEKNPNVPPDILSLFLLDSPNSECQAVLKSLLIIIIIIMRLEDLVLTGLKSGPPTCVVARLGWTKQ